MLQYNPSITGSLTITGSLVVTGNISTSGSITISGSVASASYADSLQGLGSASFAPAATFNTVSQSYAASSASLSTRVTNLETTSSVVSSSFATTSGSLSGRVTIIEGQDATTGSNTFTGVQYISEASNAIGFTSTASLYTDGGLRVAKDSFVSGTAYFNNITVYGTSSIQYITSSQVNIGSNIITVNTDTPAVRFGGLSVFDSGSTQLTGSLFWDSEKNHWIYSNPSGSTYNSGMIMSGPRNSGSLGDEQGTTFNAMMKGQGGDHITSSQVIDDGTTVRIPGALQVTGSLVGSSTATFSDTVTISKAAAISSLIIKSSSSTTGLWLYLNGLNATLSNQDNGSLAFQTNGNDRLTVTSTGNVGINTTNPVYKLDVRGQGYFATASGTNQLTLGDTTNGTTSAIATSNNNLLFYPDGSNERMRITSGGYLKASNNGSYLGSTGAYHELRQSAQSTASAVISATNASFDNNVLAIGTTRTASSTFNLIAAYANDFNDVRFVVRGDGNVGIGTSSPTALLHLAVANASVDGTKGVKITNPAGTTVMLECGVSSDSFVGTTSASDFSIRTGNSPNITIKNGGNVLIGTTTDNGGKLQVNGVTQLRDTLILVKQTSNVYNQTSTSGNTSIVDTGIFYNTSILGYGLASIYQVTISGNPQNLGSGSYRNTILGYISIGTGFSGRVQQEITWNQIFSNGVSSFGAFTVTVFFWNGTTESASAADGATNAQIRIKIAGYGGTAGAGQDVRIVKITD